MRMSSSQSSGNFTARAFLSVARTRDWEKFKGRFGLDFDF
jgi:hypothetical protein